jgi:hypothetical protein
MHEKELCVKLVIDKDDHKCYKPNKGLAVGFLLSAALINK